ncbi:hypothetical protein [Prevotella sp. HUN102]|uniref:hypothetical protein n=1 Tax=Prevotella sp. HUN102 TaxID=1392486 RepID=UPI0012DE8F18|nr:hypothetical protein [Prevotella sp. HUN102]
MKYHPMPFLSWETSLQVDEWTSLQVDEWTRKQVDEETSGQVGFFISVLSFIACH